MITLTTFGETPRVSQWLDAVRPNSTEILFSDRTQTRVQTTYSDDTHAASAVAAAVVAGVTVEKQERRMNGQARGTRVKDFDSLVGSITGDYSQEQKTLLSFLRAAGFGDLQILRPSGAYPSETGLQIDLEVLKDGKMQWAPELMRAFLNLSRVLKYGLMIFANAPILRVDMTMTNAARAVGLPDTD